MVMLGGLPKLGSLFGGGSKPAPSILNVRGQKVMNLPPGFQQVLRNADFMDTATPTDITLVSGSYVQMGAGFTIPAQTSYRWGYGQAELAMNEGYIFLQFMDDTAGDATNEDGTARFLASDAQGTRRFVVFEMETEELDGAANDKALRIALPEMGPVMQEDDRALLELRGRAVDIVQPDFSTVRIPVTRYQ